MDTGAYLRTLARAQAASGAGTWRDAIPLWEAIVAANPVEGRHWERLADACHHGGAYERAIFATERALALGAGYPAEGHYHLACCHVLRGDHDRALDALGRAFALGYRHTEQAQADPDLVALRDDARFRRIVALLDTADLDRDAGWRLISRTSSARSSASATPPSASSPRPTSMPRWRRCTRRSQVAPTRRSSWG